MVKRGFAILVVLLVLGGPALFALDLTVGAKVGGSHNFSYGSDFKDDLDAAGVSQEFKFGMSVGAFIEIGLAPAFAIQPEVYYTTSGYKVEDNEDFTIKFLQFVALLKGRFAAGKVGIQVFGGPTLLYGVGDWTVKLPGLPEIEFDKDDRETADIRNTHLGVVVGTGVMFNGIGPGQLGVEARGTIGFQNFDETDTYIQKNIVIGIMVSYGIPIM